MEWKWVVGGSPLPEERMGGTELPSWSRTSIVTWTLPCALLTTLREKLAILLRAWVVPEGEKSALHNLMYISFLRSPGKTTSGKLRRKVMDAPCSKEEFSRMIVSA
jgi:hypothetical protein